MERFINPGQGECIVLKRKGDSALILAVENKCTPYIVPMEHRQGNTEWWGGSYFEDLGEALEYWEEAVK